MLNFLDTTNWEMTNLFTMTKNMLDSIWPYLLPSLKIFLLLALSIGLFLLYYDIKKSLSRRFYFTGKRWIIIDDSYNNNKTWNRIMNSLTMSNAIIKLIQLLLTIPVILPIVGILKWGPDILPFIYETYKWINLDLNLFSIVYNYLFYYSFFIVYYLTLIVIIRKMLFLLFSFLLLVFQDKKLIGNIRWIIFQRLSLVWDFHEGFHDLIELFIKSICNDYKIKLIKILILTPIIIPLVGIIKLNPYLFLDIYNYLLENIWNICMTIFVIVITMYAFMWYFTILIFCECLIYFFGTVLAIIYFFFTWESPLEYYGLMFLPRLYIFNLEDVIQGKNPAVCNMFPMSPDKGKNPEVCDMLPMSPDELKKYNELVPVNRWDRMEEYRVYYTDNPKDSPVDKYNWNNLIEFDTKEIMFKKLTPEMNKTDDFWNHGEKEGTNILQSFESDNFKIGGLEGNLLWWRTLSSSSILRVMNGDGTCTVPYINPDIRVRPAIAFHKWITTASCSYVESIYNNVIYSDLFVNYKDAQWERNLVALKQLEHFHINSQLQRGIQPDDLVSIFKSTVKTFIDKFKPIELPMDRDILEKESYKYWNNNKKAFPRILGINNEKFQLDHHDLISHTFRFLLPYDNNRREGSIQVRIHPLREFGDIPRDYLFYHKDYSDLSKNKDRLDLIYRIEVIRKLKCLVNHMDINNLEKVDLNFPRRSLYGRIGFTDRDLEYVRDAITMSPKYVLIDNTWTNQYAIVDLIKDRKSRKIEYNTLTRQFIVDTIHVLTKSYNSTNSSTLTGVAAQAKSTANATANATAGSSQW